MVRTSRNIIFAIMASIALAACSTSGERIGGAGVGAIAGGAVAGPVGAVVGGVAGAVTGPAVSREVGIPHRRYHKGRRVHKRYIKAT